MIGVPEYDDLFTCHVKAEDFVPEGHPLREIRACINATNLRSSLEWSSSKVTTIGRLRNNCSHSAWDTSCLTQVFSEFPSSR
jgi:hypothetical protein